MAANSKKLTDAEVALARFEHQVRLWVQGMSPEDRQRALEMLDKLEAKFLAGEEAETHQ